jgi:hypothetical protein
MGDVVQTCLIAYLLLLERVLLMPSDHPVAYCQAALERGMVLM